VDPASAVEADSQVEDFPEADSEAAEAALSKTPVSYQGIALAMPKSLRYRTPLYGLRRPSSRPLLPAGTLPPAYRIGAP
jgi:hypothetical protein